MVAQVQRLVTQCGSQMRAICRALAVFQTETPKPTNEPNYSRFIAQL
jgi:hypothetical protein